MKDLVSFTEFLIKGLCKEPDLVKVESFSSDDEAIILEIIVHSSDMANVIGRNGKMISSIRSIIQAYSALHDNKKVKINIDSF